MVVGGGDASDEGCGCRLGMMLANGGGVSSN